VYRRRCREYTFCREALCHRRLPSVRRHVGVLGQNYFRSQLRAVKKTTEKGYMEIRGRTDYLKTDVTLAIWSRNFIARQYRKCDMPCRTLQFCRINKNWLISVRRLFATKLHRIIERCSNRIRSCSAYKAKNILFLRTLLPKKPKIERMGQRTGHTHPHVNITCEMRQRKRHARDAPFVKSLGVWT